MPTLITILLLISYFAIFLWLAKKSEPLKELEKSDKWKFKVGTFSFLLLINLIIFFIGIISYYISGTIQNKWINTEFIPHVIFGFSILATQTSHTILTDPNIHRVDKWLNRLGYIFSIILVCDFIFTRNLSFLTIPLLIMLFVSELLILIMFFVFTSIGSADFRLLAISTPLSMISMRFEFFIPVVLSLLCSAIYQFIIQKKHGDSKMSVPIGHIIILVNLLYYTGYIITQLYI